jgi:LysM repeat protein
MCKIQIPLDKLKAANGLDTDHIYAGENLVIPED